MSQSMGWADNIILAMAPIGIVTAIVAAIRVGGPSWLKAIIGRARENVAVSEAELMSSTSKEVCEVWNGREVVRSMGVAPVVEFICLLQYTDVALFDSQVGPEIEVLGLGDAIKKRYIKDLGKMGAPFYIAATDKRPEADHTAKILTSNRPGQRIRLQSLSQTMSKIFNDTVVRGIRSATRNKQTRDQMLMRSFDLEYHLPTSLEHPRTLRKQNGHSKKSASSATRLAIHRTFH
jgi:hypothetical protein